MKKLNQTQDAHNDIHSTDCIDSMKLQMAAMKSNGEGIRHNSGGPIFEEVSIITPEMMGKLGTKREPFKFSGIDFGDIDNSVIIEGCVVNGVIVIESIK